MIPYKKVVNDSGILAYQIGDSWIRIQFATGGVYEYTYASAGRKNIETMKRFAVAGDGLNTFINQSVKGNYSRRL